MSELIAADDSNFNTLLAGHKAVIVDFWSPGCVPCFTIEPGLKKIATDYRNDVKVLKVNVNNSPRISSQYSVRGLPTLLFFKDGLVQTQLVGAVPPNQIEKKVREVYLR